MIIRVNEKNGEYEMYEIYEDGNKIDREDIETIVRAYQISVEKLNYAFSLDTFLDELGVSYDLYDEDIEVFEINVK